MKLKTTVIGVIRLNARPENFCKSLAMKRAHFAQIDQMVNTRTKLTAIVIMYAKTEKI
jgi:hypothetical protein